MSDVTDDDGDDLFWAGAPMLTMSGVTFKHLMEESAEGDAARDALHEALRKRRETIEDYPQLRRFPKP